MDRPKCADKAPDITASKKLLEKLLQVELNRLEVATRIEAERKIVFPETSIIIHDILKLRQALDADTGDGFEFPELL